MISNWKSGTENKADKGFLRRINYYENFTEVCQQGPIKIKPWTSIDLIIDTGNGELSEPI